jgi:uroporphyrinogen decarboxylase
VTLQPVRALGVDAAILFADILLPVIPLGLGLEFAKGEGPVIGRPVRTLKDVEALRPVDAETDLGYVMEAIRALRGELNGVPLIGFCGAPFTVASYMIEGGSTREFLKTKTMMYSAPEVWHALMDRLSNVLVDYLIAQIRAGAQAVQLFDSWAGALSPDDYRTSVQPWSHRVLEDLPVPSIHFGVGTGELLDAMRDAGGNAIGVDWRVPLDRAWERVGTDRSIQGNLDPAACLASWDAVDRAATLVLERAAMRDGHVFNLGHGVLPSTPVETLERLVDLVHERTSRPNG